MAPRLIKEHRQVEYRHNVQKSLSEKLKYIPPKINNANDGALDN